MGTTYGIAQFAPSQIIRQRVCVSVCVCVQHLHTNFSFMGCHLTFAVSGPRFEVFPLLTCGQLKCAAFNFFNFNSEAHSLGGLSLLPKTSFSYGRSCHLSRSLLSAGLQPRAWSWAHEIHARARYIYIYTYMVVKLHNMYVNDQQLLYQSTWWLLNEPDNGAWVLEDPSLFCRLAKVIVHPHIQFPRLDD